jgi:hypothetical protein
MTDAIEWLDHLPADKRMAAYLDEALSGEDRDDRIRKLATELGYAHGKTVHSWTTGAAKVPLRLLTPLALNLGRDVSELLPMWIAQEMAGTDEDRLYRAARRCVSAWEWGLIAVARDIYWDDSRSL